MKLLPDWGHVLNYAWSIKYSVLAGLFAMAEVGLPLYIEHFPRGWFAMLSMAAAFGSVVCRICAQKEFPREPCKLPGAGQ